MSIAEQEFPDIVGIKPVPAPAPFEPYIPAATRLRELTPLPVIVGTILGMIFGASSLYLVLKVGLTVSASIPVAVISITFFRLLSKFGYRKASILENNIVQTAGSAGESIAFGVGVTMPAIMILGFDLEITRVMLVAILGGLLDLGGDLSGAARRRLHHRPAHRLDHVRRRRARLPGADPGDQVLRRRRHGDHRARHRADQPDGTGRDPRCLRSLHRRRCGG